MPRRGPPPLMSEDGSAHLADRLRFASLPCENCGKVTGHRILRWDRAGSGSRGRLSGIARCQECRWTHPFQQVPATFVEVALVVSEGPRSTRRRLRIPAQRRLEVGSGLPESDAELRIRRLDDRAGDSVPAAPSESVSTIWATVVGPLRVPVSIVERARTRPARWVTDADTEVEIGDAIRVDADSVVVVGIRADGKTWKLAGDRFRAEDVQRLYVRRRAMPPAGSSPWSRVRVRPSSPVSSTSRASRSRSAPGTRTTRTVPRAAIAAGGAAVQSVAPS